MSSPDIQQWRESGSLIHLLPDVQDVLHAWSRKGVQASLVEGRVCYSFSLLWTELLGEGAALSSQAASSWFFPLCLLIPGLVRTESWQAQGCWAGSTTSELAFHVSSPPTARVGLGGKHFCKVQTTETWPLTQSLQSSEAKDMTLERRTQSGLNLPLRGLLTLLANILSLQ